MGERWGSRGARRGRREQRVHLHGARLLERADLSGGDGLHRRELGLELESLGTQRGQLGVDAAQLALRAGVHPLGLGGAAVERLQLGLR